MRSFQDPASGAIKFLQYNCKICTVERLSRAATEHFSFECPMRQNDLTESSLDFALTIDDKIYEEDVDYSSVADFFKLPIPPHLSNIKGKYYIHRSPFQIPFSDISKWQQATSYALDASSSSSSSNPSTDLLPQILQPRPLYDHEEGKAFCNYHSTTARMRVGMSSTAGISIDGLLDDGSNTSLMDSRFFREHYPNILIHNYKRLRLRSVAIKHTTGYAIIHVWMEGLNHHENRVFMQLEVEVHFLDDFEPFILLGLDTLHKYGLSSHLQTDKAMTTIYSDIHFPIRSRRNTPPEIELALLHEVTIPPRTQMKLANSNQT
ncbi:hypothetical protein BJ508DRAFT_322049 [Ascobolus immersus RN42]|uniref:Peptidase A2 domain-containing protein n=1 Tax=Ascobolus immersus RN42 TaxID=1160509 RepID=A0A3N4IW90_ASCIM|nr:hypothetical protein BJ508DRAFT_322049 [Ascobolus immersus RN42]